MNNANESTFGDQPEVIEVNALDTIERAQIDMQIATARKFPRSIAQVKRNMLDFATLDTETAQGCFYTLPARKGAQSSKPIQGPSVRLAEIAIASYGNLRAGMRIVGNDGKFITAQGFVHDLEKNISVAMEVRRRITKRDGSTYGEDMQQVAGAAACSVAFRNAVFKVVPLALIKPVYDKCLMVAAGDEKSLVQRRVDCFKAFDALGVKREHVCAAVGAKGVEDINNERLLLLIGFHNAIRDGEMTAAEIFEPRPDETVAPATAGGLASVDTPKPTPRMDPKLNPAPAPTPPPVAKPPVATIAPPPAPEPADIPEPATSVAPVENIQEAMKAREAKTTPPPESDSLQIKRGIVNAIEGLALDLDLNLSNLYDMLAIVAENRATTKLVDCSIPQLVTLKARLEKTARERKAAPATK